MFKSSSTSLILIGVLAVIAGIVALAWPGITLLVIVIMFAVYAFTDAVLQATRAFSSAGAGPVVGHLLIGLIDVAAGICALAWPSPTLLALVWVVGIWAIVGGGVEFFAGFGSGETAGLRALLLLGGLISVAFGVFVLARPGAGAFTLALAYGVFALCYGVSQITAGVQLRSAGREISSVLGDAA
jgi:uncharacterized membrane protein HdeD (DUF308 family)